MIKVWKITVNPIGNIKTIEYDPRGLVKAETDFNGNKTIYEYDKLGRVVNMINPLNGVSSNIYDANGNILTQTNENGNKTTYQYDALDRVIKRKDAYNNETNYAYNYLGLISSITDALGNTKNKEYDELSRLTKDSNELGKSKLYEYDYNGNMIKLTDELNRVKEYSYDSLNRMTKEKNTLGEEIGYLYDAIGNMIGEIDAKGVEYKYEYDKLNRMVKEINRLGNEQMYEYDPNSNMIKKIDFNSNEQNNQFDKLNRLIKSSFSDGTQKEYEYDANGNIIRSENENTSLLYEYDQLNRVIRSEDGATDEIIKYKYDAVGNRIETKWLDDKRRIYKSYGKINELLKVTDPDGYKTYYKYDALGREIYKFMPNSVITGTKYDAAGRITQIKNINKKGNSKNKWYSWFWSGAPEVLKSEAYLYNDVGERIYQVEDDGKITAYNYDDIGRIDTVKYPFYSNKRVEDFRERLTFGLFPEYEKIKSKGKGKHGWGSYDDNNNNDDELELNIPNIDKYDNHNEFKDKLKEVLKDKHDIFKHYNKMDKYYHGRWRIKIDEGATEFASRLSVDASTADLLKEAYSKISSDKHPNPYYHNYHNHLNTKQWMWTEKYEYDEVNNRSRKANGWGVIDYTYNPAYEIQKAGKREYEHDLNGNMIKEKLGIIEGMYEYNPENRTSNIYSEYAGFIGWHEWSLEAGVKYNYDAYGRRINRVQYKEYNQKYGKHNYEWKKETNESYIYDGLSFNVLAELRDKDFNHPYKYGWGWWRHYHYKGKYQPVSEYIYGNGRLINRTDFIEYDPFKYKCSKYANGYKDKYNNHGNNYGYGYSKWRNKEYYSQNVLGSIMLLTDQHGSRKESYSYDAYGNTYEGNFFRVNDYGYNGKRYDLTVGLYNYGYRDYKSKLGRWTSVDPIKDNINWYMYCNNDPVNFIDPDGLTFESSEEWTPGNVPQPVTSSTESEGAKPSTRSTSIIDSHVPPSGYRVDVTRFSEDLMNQYPELRSVAVIQLVNNEQDEVVDTDLGGRATATEDDDYQDSLRAGSMGLTQYGNTLQINRGTTFAGLPTLDDDPDAPETPYTEHHLIHEVGPSEGCIIVDTENSILDYAREHGIMNQINKLNIIEIKNYTPPTASMYYY